ncbi:MAG: DUF5110 domain-containing protein, partial [Acidobacteriaceae bacterium]|nr:DUF5110 domain-containing protein [Acidobacteriaceae bacterium]
MSRRWSRRQILKQAAANAALLLADSAATGSEARLRVAGSEVEVHITPVSRCAFRWMILPIRDGQPAEISSDGSLVWTGSEPSAVKMQGAWQPQAIRVGDLQVKLAAKPFGIAVESASRETIQRLKLDASTGALSFDLGNGPLLGLGEGGQQFDRHGFVDTTRNGQAGYKLATYGGRVSIPWLIGAEGWAMFVHAPVGHFDLSGSEGKFDAAVPLPLDLFFVASREPAVIMAEYARLTGKPELPPLWTFGYQQSHRTLSSEKEVIQEAQTFRDKKLPCDALIYLGTGFCPSGWNTENGSFEWNRRVFPDPKETIDRLHDGHFRIVLHVVILTNQLQGTVHDNCELARFSEDQASCYWDAHRKDYALGVDGWWPDEGDPLDRRSRLVRNRMYWEGPQIDRPNERPYALHRNAYAGMQRYGAFLWSGDVYSTWETLSVHVSNAINTGLSGMPYWGTDIGGFVPTPEFTAELYLRWFQFGAFCPLFRAHGRNWKLRLPWGWDTGDPGPMEISNYGGAAIPDPNQLHNAQVEPICRKYLELRYRMLPYLYSVVRECTLTGMPILRALWLHYPEDPAAVARGDEYLWGPSVLVAPVVERGAKTRQLYLPRGSWTDYWTGEVVQGGREISRPVDLETTPLYVRAGSIIPTGPVKQYSCQKVDEPLSIHIYPGADCRFVLYEDDGVSFRYRAGERMGTVVTWKDKQRVGTLELAKGSRMLTSASRPIQFIMGPNKKQVIFEGTRTTVRF